MKSIIISIILILSVINCSNGQEPVSINVSFKLITDTDGNHPECDVDTIMKAVNIMLASYKRGFTINYGVNIIGGTNHPASNDYYNIDTLRNFKDALELDAEFEIGLYKWRSDSINIYITKSSEGGGSCSFPEEDEVILISYAGFERPKTVLHEIGHFFNLKHTFQGHDFLDCEGNARGNDNVVYTLPDKSLCWSDSTAFDSIALNYYKIPYGLLSPTQKDSVDITFKNVMSYRSSTNLLVDEQLNIIQDQIVIHPNRRVVVTGDQVYVDDSQWNHCSICTQGTHDNPYIDLNAAIIGTAISGGDALILRPGEHSKGSGTLLISNPVFITADKKDGETEKWAIIK